MKRILGLLATGLLAFGANNASAIPLQIEIGGAGAGASGVWELSGNGSSETVAWAGLIAGYASWMRDLSPGTYTWEISGNGYLAAVGWRLTLSGQEIFSGSDSGFNPFRSFRIFDDHTFAAVAVPEPGTLGLLGLGLWAAGFAASRRRKASA